MLTSDLRPNIRNKNTMASSRDCSNFLRVLQDGSDWSMDDSGWLQREDILKNILSTSSLFGHPDA